MVVQQRDLQQEIQMLLGQQQATATSRPLVLVPGLSCGDTVFLDAAFSGYVLLTKFFLIAIFRSLPSHP